MSAGEVIFVSDVTSLSTTTQCLAPVRWRNGALQQLHMITEHFPSGESRRTEWRDVPNAEEAVEDGGK